MKQTKTKLITDSALLNTQLADLLNKHNTALAGDKFSTSTYTLIINILNNTHFDPDSELFFNLFKFHIDADTHNHNYNNNCGIVSKTLRTIIHKIDSSNIDTVTFSKIIECYISISKYLGYGYINLDNLVQTINLGKVDINIILNTLLDNQLYGLIFILVNRIKHTDMILTNIHNGIMRNKTNLIHIGINISVVKLYELFISNLIYPTKLMLLEILEFIPIKYELIQDIITKKEYVTCRFKNCNRDNTYDCQSLYNMLQDDEDYRKYFLYKLSHCSFRISDCKRYKKALGIKFDNKLFAEYVRKTKVINKKVLQFFVDEGTELDMDTILGIVLNTSKLGKTIIGNLKIVRPKFDFEHFGYGDTGKPKYVPHPVKNTTVRVENSDVEEDDDKCLAEVKKTHMAPVKKTTVCVKNSDVEEDDDEFLAEVEKAHMQ